MNDDQKKMLQAPLNREHVKTREQGGASVSYIEGWHAIAEANRIFGFDGWTRETIYIECVWSGMLKNRKGNEYFACTYNAKVRVTAIGAIREGCGSGHGQSYGNPGDAHESAIKEAETDAMKRALMTFGNPFGLALYDKDQAAVADYTEEEQADALKLIEQIEDCHTREVLDSMVKSEEWKEAVGSLPDKLKGQIRQAYKSKHDKLKG